MRRRRYFRFTEAQEIRPPIRSAATTRNSVLIEAVQFAMQRLTGPSFCTKLNGRNFIIAIDCETEFGGRRKLQPSGTGGLYLSAECRRTVLYFTRHISITTCASFND
jgi:hypothetical protein